MSAAPARNSKRWFWPVIIGGVAIVAILAIVLGSRGGDGGNSGGTGATPTQTALGTRSGNPVSGGVASYTPTGTNTPGAATSRRGLQARGSCVPSGST